MKGFDPKFRDFPDYILKITKEIWEDRGLGARMKDYYHPEVVVRTPWGISVGEPAMTAATMATVVEFPDRELLGEDVIWSGDPEAGMLSSHRIYSRATHGGSGLFGAATRRPIGIYALADCYAKDGQISDEWLIRDNGGLVRQIGEEPRDWALRKVEQGMRAFTADQDRAGPYSGRGNEHALGQRLAELLERLMAAEFSIIPEAWDRAAELHYPGGVEGHGWRDADRAWLGLRAAFPSAEFTVHHVIGREDPMMAPRAAVRWSLDGLHDGWGAFGAPSGARVHVMGITQAEFGPWGLRREWTLWDETAIWMQIHAGGAA
ncbi:nuclear transport factor 2 family protein [Aestuariibius sp. 2305UL40-4]|uniref:nuclear transport factor 2 family protein n=1 Tax=Aestuariibius violaceus TaxID=3234132 RepID=UPI00345E44A9